MPQWSIETRTRLISEANRAQIRHNMLIGLRRITVKSIFYTKVDNMITAITISLFLKSEKFLLFVSCRETQHRAVSENLQLVRACKRDFSNFLLEA